MKKLIIIHGVTGAIGSACFGLFTPQKDTVVYGISRRAKPFEELCTNGKLPTKTLIGSISSEYPPRMARILVDAIQNEEFDEIYYIHALGVYPFEIDINGNRTVQYDNDMDGLDDRCLHLTNLMFGSFFRTLSFGIKKPVHAILFGGIADKHRPFVHTSWWKSIEKLKGDIAHEHEKGATGIVSLINISSVLCPNEIINRPFVFSSTNADPAYWLQPIEVANFVQEVIKEERIEKFKEYELFKKLPEFEDDYYTDEKFTPRKISELFKKKE